MTQFFLTADDLEALCIGATLLGSGGGGDPQPDYLRAKELMLRFGSVRMMEVETLDDEALVVPIGFVGAPLVSLEKLPSGKECSLVIEMVQHYFKRPATALVAAEIGGSNAFIPLTHAASSGLPVLDADCLGRAFPELHMSACALAGVLASPAFIADSIGNTAIVNAGSAKKVEQMCRALTVSMGSSVAAAMYVMSGKQAKQALIRRTFSQALLLGKEILSSPQAMQKHLIGHGVISDIHQEIVGGFLQGRVVVGDYQIDFQNEYLRVTKEGQTCACTPEIIAILDAETGRPLPVERLKFGLAVDLMVLEAPQIWKTEAGLALVGPQAFGYTQL